VASGFFILIKRLSLSKLRNLSNPDDYISNFLVTIFQVATILLLLTGQKAEFQHNIIASILLLYLPLGKLKHVVYFFAARYQLGLFFGRRGVWR
jgi:nitrate reductase gamma subunit